MRVRPRIIVVLASILVAATCVAQLRVCTYNVTNYSSGRVTAFQTAIYGVFQTRSLSPDVLVGQEFISQTSVNNFRNLLNSAPGSPGDWLSAPFIDGADTDSALFYRNSRVQYLGTTIVAVGSSSTSNQPRNTYRYDVRPKNYSGAAATLAIYSVHMKAGSSSEDQARRLIEAERIRDDAEVLPADWTFAVAGDFNVQTSTQAAYQELVGSQLNNAGRCFDPIKTPGSWNNNGGFRFVHTQDPATAMDDRYDFILLSESLLDGVSFDYIGNSSIAYSQTTWNDPNHSYRAWGNDGSSYNNPLNVATNSMVGPSIAQALIDAANGQGHLPVYLDCKVPPKSHVSATTIEFGSVARGTYQTRAFDVRNSGDTTLWSSNGIANLNYSLTASNDFYIPPNQFWVPPGTAGRRHYVAMNTMTPGEKFGTLTVTSNDPENPVRVISLHGFVQNGPPVGIVP